MDSITRISAWLAAAAALLLNPGCSEDAIKRTSFETLQNLHAQQCSRDLSGHCPPPENYEDYRRERAAALKSGDGTEPRPSP